MRNPYLIMKIKTRVNFIMAAIWCFGGVPRKDHEVGMDAGPMAATEFWKCLTHWLLGLPQRTEGKVTS